MTRIVRIMARTAAGLVILVAACAAPAPAPSSTPDLTPLTGPPEISDGLQFISRSDGRIWTFDVYLDPRGSPTSVDLETGSGTPAAPTFGPSVRLRSGLLMAGELFLTWPGHESGSTFCFRLTATNTLGSASAPIHCDALGPPPSSGRGSSGPASSGP
jgi:hypothetical protein